MPPWRDLTAGRSPSRLLTLATALWLPVATAATVLAGTGYALAQHVLRSAANDPQLQVAQDAARRLAGGEAAADVAAGPDVDLATSLALSVGVFDTADRPLASTARLGGTVARPPVGAMHAARTGGQDVLTWQPRPGVRLAAVIVPFTGPQGAGTVVAARSLRLVEQRENDVLVLAGLGWLVALCGAAVAALLGAALWPPP